VRQPPYLRSLEGSQQGRLATKKPATGTQVAGKHQKQMGLPLARGEPRPRDQPPPAELRLRISRRREIHWLTPPQKCTSRPSFVCAGCRHGEKVTPWLVISQAPSKVKKKLLIKRCGRCLFGTRHPMT